MGGQFVVVSSITYAYKGQNALERRGIRAGIERAPKEIAGCGCHYALHIRNATAAEAAEILRAARVKIVSVGGAGDDLS